MQMYDVEAKIWITREEMPKRYIDKLEKRNKPVNKEIVEESSNGGYEELVSKVGELELGQRELKDYMFSLASWQGSMFQGIYEMFEINGYAPPPIPSWGQCSTEVDTSEDEVEEGDEMEDNETLASFVEKERRSKNKHDVNPDV